MLKVISLKSIFTTGIPISIVFTPKDNSRPIAIGCAGNNLGLPILARRYSVKLQSDTSTLLGHRSVMTTSLQLEKTRVKSVDGALPLRRGAI